MKETSKKIQATIRASLMNDQEISSDERVKHIKLMEKIIDAVDQYHNQPRKVKSEVSKIVDDHASL